MLTSIRATPKTSSAPERESLTRWWFSEQPGGPVHVDGSCTDPTGVVLARAGWAAAQCDSEGATAIIKAACIVHCWSKWDHVRMDGPERDRDRTAPFVDSRVTASTCRTAEERACLLLAAAEREDIDLRPGDPFFFDSQWRHGIICCFLCTVCAQ